MGWEDTPTPHQLPDWAEGLREQLPADAAISGGASGFRAVWQTPVDGRPPQEWRLYAPTSTSHVTLETPYGRLVIPSSPRLALEQALAVLRVFEAIPPARPIPPEPGQG